MPRNWPANPRTGCPEITRPPCRAFAHPWRLPLNPGKESTLHCSGYHHLVRLPSKRIPHCRSPGGYRPKPLRSHLKLLSTKKRKIFSSYPDLTNGHGRPHVRWCGRGNGRNPVASTRSNYELARPLPPSRLAPQQPLDRGRETFRGIVFRQPVWDGLRLRQIRRERICTYPKGAGQDCQA